MPKASILLLAYRFPPEIASGAARPYRFYKYLPEYGYDCEVVTSGVQPVSEPRNIHRAPAETNHLKSIRGASFACAQLQRWLLPYNEQLPWLPHAIAAANTALSKRRFAAVLSTSPPLVTHLAALSLKRKHRLAWIADFRDPLVGNPFRNRRIAARYDAMIERTLFRHADALLGNTDTTVTAWRERYPQWADKMQVIWNGFDPEEPFGPAPIPPRPYKLLSHVGTLYGGRRPKLLLDSVERLIDRGELSPSSFKIEFTGPMEQNTDRSFTRLLEMGCVRCTPPVPRAEAMRKVAESDLLLLLDLNESDASFQVPAKIFDYIRTGRPILAFTPKDSPVQRILKGAGPAHVCVHPDDPPGISDQKLLAFLHLDGTSIRASEWFWREFDGRAQAGAVAATLDRLMGLSASPHAASSLPAGSRVSLL
jgi:hypothetical protein